MGIRLELFERERYEDICKLFAEREVSPPPLAILPRLGYLAFDESGLAAVAWLYMDNSVGVCWPHFLCARKGLDLRQARGVCDAIIDTMSATARDLGYGIMIAGVSGEALASELESRGFSRLCSTVNMVKVLQPSNG